MFCHTVSPFIFPLPLTKTKEATQSKLPESNSSKLGWINTSSFSVSWYIRKLTCFKPWYIWIVACVRFPWICVRHYFRSLASNIYVYVTFVRMCVSRIEEIIGSSWKYKRKTALKTHAMLLWISRNSLFSYPWRYNFTSKTISVHAVTFPKSKSVHETGTSYSSRKLILPIYLAPLLEMFACTTVLIFSADMCFHFNNIPVFPLFCWHVVKNLEQTNQ